jgi:glycosyltransferase involved in cell wall biosynthesis
MIIVHVITRFIRGGADENTLLSCNAQAAAGHDVHLVYGGEASAPMVARLDRRVHRHQVSWLQRPIAPIDDLRALVDMVKLFQRVQPDIVHTHTSKAGIIGRAAARLCRVKGIVHGVHILPFVNVPPAQASLYLALEKALAPSTHAFVNVSDGMRDLGIEYGVGHEDRHYVIPSGMDVHAFRSAVPFSSTEIDRRLGKGAGGSPLIVLVAALEPRKRQYEFLDVFAAVRRAVPGVRLVLLGEGLDEKRLRERVAVLDIAQAVSFAGFSTEVERWIASASVCAFSSEREGLPRAVIQYAMVGAPIVSTRLPGIEQVVKDGATGYLVDVDRLDLMVEPIVRLLTDHALAAETRRAARELDLCAWDLPDMVRQLNAVYQSILDEDDLEISDAA